ncbi:Rossmann-fold NAD(P)-binding domain-containing protein [Saccharibacillus alkalitolerans]|uniref:Short-chain dehydrogenase n=1 Tax=Saccharibacillus alkalitolerans TaxID=2705290 RepID=A0ABX0F9M7_9BACL|nr:hypothetical protein [Saccharibacillus alkalitolerans]NGZ76729.1 hypothetical protein [Saccharibacillus alkalitolerans]
MDRTAWILNLREPFGAALGRELTARGWKVVGGDPGEEREILSVPGQRKIGEEGEIPAAGRPNAEGIEEPGGSSGWTHGTHIGENPEIPTGTGTSGLNDFEGSVAFGPESNGRHGGYEQEEREGTDTQVKSAQSNAAAASSSAGAFSDADSAASLPEHGRMHVVPLDLDQPGEAWEEAARLTAGLADRIDLLVLNAGEIVPERDGEAGADSVKEEAIQAADIGADFPAEGTTEERLRDYEAYALTPLRAVEHLLPLMDAEGGLKRICFVSSHEGSISAGHADVPIGRAMARTALHMQAKLLFNDLGREGYTFRLYDPGLSPLRGAMPGGLPGAADSSGSKGDRPAAAAEPMMSLPAMVGESARFAAGFFTNPHADEERLVLTGSRGEEWPF